MSDGRWKRADARHHDREAPRYDRLIGREFAPYQHTHTARPWARLLRDAGARVVLDIGCGTGRTTLPLAQAGLTVIATDLSRGMLAQARAKLRAMDAAAAFVVADVEHLPLRDAAVDGAVCQGVLHHLPDVTRAIQEADRVLDDGGLLCIAEPDAEGSTLSAAVRTVVGFLRPALGLLRGARSPAADNERPLPPAAVLGPLEARGYTLTARYLTHPPFLYRVLPPVISRRLAAWLNHGDRSRPRPADIIVVRARKPDRPPFAARATESAPARR